MTGQRLVDQRRALVPVGDLNSLIAVRVASLDLCDAIGVDLDHRHRDGCTILGKNAGHAALASDETDTHGRIVLSRA